SGNRLRRNPRLAPNLADFLATNKRSATLDFDALDESFARTLCERADLLLVDTSEPFVQRLLQERVYEQSNAVLTVITPWGLESPYAALCEDELLAFALSGIASVTPEDAEDPVYERPMQLYGHQAQFAAGLTAAVASLEAWFAAQQDGRPRLVDLAVLDALASMPIISQAAVFAGNPLPRPPSERPQTVPRGFLLCRDGYVYTQGGDDNWPGWAQLLGRREWEQPPFSEPAYREQHWPELGAAIQRWLDAQSNADVYRACQAKGITCFPVNTIGQVVANSQVAQREVFGTVRRRDGAAGFRAPRTPFRLLAPALASEPDTAPALGADLAWLEATFGLPRVAAEQR
ncbi:MAG TPA: CoA transferase, partial [Dehalococcoidia bacterium]|nr:CoA transferase [Dehalococcoidia bacterium]